MQLNNKKNILLLKMILKFSMKKTIILLPIILILLFIIVSSLLTPFIKNLNMLKLYKFINILNSKICHQYPPRCLSLFNNNIGLCARCFAFYTTMFFYTLINLFIDFHIDKRTKSYIFIVLISPLIIDGITQYFQIRESTFFLRTVTGIMGGIGVSVILIPFYCNFFKAENKKIFEEKQCEQ